MTGSVNETTVVALERPVYGMGEAARYLGLRTQKVRAWLDGSTRSGIFYPPVIRERQLGNDVVTWGEFIELGYLREYRNAGVSLQHLRPVIKILRDRYGTPYPLAHHKLYVDGRQLVMKVQEENNIPPQLAMVVRTGQTLSLSGPVERFLRKVEFGADDKAARWHPAGKTSPVVIDPLMRFGQPSVRGVSTERLWELSDAGDPVDYLAATYELDERIVEAAIAYEEQQRSIAA